MFVIKIIAPITLSTFIKFDGYNIENTLHLMLIVKLFDTMFTNNLNFIKLDGLTLFCSIK